MRAYLVILWCGLFCAQAFAQRTLVVKEDSLPAYQNRVRQMNDAPIFELMAGEQVKTLEEYSDVIKVEAGGNRTGWVAREGLDRKVQSVFTMKELKVYGYLDNMDPIYILDFENDQQKAIHVNKDFVFDPRFMMNIDREEFEWENEVLYYKGAVFQPFSPRNEEKEKDENNNK